MIKMTVYCQNCIHYKGDGEKCVDNNTIGIADIPLKDPPNGCPSYKEKVTKR